MRQDKGVEKPEGLWGAVTAPYLFVREECIVKLRQFCLQRRHDFVTEERVEGDGVELARPKPAPVAVANVKLKGDGEGEGEGKGARVRAKVMARARARVQGCEGERVRVRGLGRGHTALAKLSHKHIRLPSGSPLKNCWSRPSS